MLNQWLSERGFAISHQVDGKRSIASLFAASCACGIYFLHFGNNEYYVGLAKNVVKRYVQHRQTHSDICRISFKPVAVENLKRVESADIEFFKTRVRLRNIDEMEDLIMERDFDKLVHTDFAERFLHELSYNDLTGDKYQNAELQSNYKYRQCFELLSQHNFYNELLAVSSLYVRTCLPAPSKTEYAFWSVTCFRFKPEAVIIRLNIYQQEVFTVYLTKLNNDSTSLDYSFQLAKTPLATMVSGRSNRTLIEQQCPSAKFDDHFYRTGGKDQMRLAVLAKDITRLFSLPPFIEATRLLNLRLMRKGANMNRVSHCMDLAEAMLISLS